MDEREPSRLDFYARRAQQRCIAGCNGNGSNYACFYHPTTPFALTNNMVFDIFFAGGTADFSLPHLKVDFWILSFQCKSTGSLLSQDIPLAATPLPAALPLFITGLGAMGLLGWYRRRKAVQLA